MTTLCFVHCCLEKSSSPMPVSKLIFAKASLSNPDARVNHSWSVVWPYHRMLLGNLSLINWDIVHVYSATV